MTSRIVVNAEQPERSAACRLPGAARARRSAGRALTQPEPHPTAQPARAAPSAYAWPDPLDHAAPGGGAGRRRGVIHLLGEPVSQRWSAGEPSSGSATRACSRRAMLVAGAARSSPTRSVRRCSCRSRRPATTARADDRELDEHAPAGSDFLAGVVSDWEQEALRRRARRCAWSRDPHRRRPVPSRRRAGEDAPVLPRRHRRPGRRRPPVRPVDPHR